MTGIGLGAQTTGDAAELFKPAASACRRWSELCRSPLLTLQSLPTFLPFSTVLTLKQRKVQFPAQENTKIEQDRETCGHRNLRLLWTL